MAKLVFQAVYHQTLTPRLYELSISETSSTIAIENLTWPEKMSIHGRLRHRLTCRKDPCPHRLQEIAARAPRQSFRDRSGVRYDCGSVRAATIPQLKKSKSECWYLPSITLIEFWEGMIHTATVKYDESYLIDIACHLTSGASSPTEQYVIVAAASRRASDLAIMAGLLELQDLYPELLAPEERKISRSREDPSRAVKFFLKTCLDLARYPGHVSELGDTLEDVERKEALEDHEFMEMFGPGGTAWDSE